MEARFGPASVYVHFDACSHYTPVESGRLPGDFSKKVHVLISLSHLDMNFEAATGDQSTHHLATATTSAEVSAGPQADHPSDGMPAASEGSAESSVRAIKWTTLSTSFCFGPRRISGVFAVGNGLDYVVLCLAVRGEPTFDRCPHLPTIECVEARFHKSSHREPGRPSRDRKYDSRDHGAPYPAPSQGIYSSAIAGVSLTLTQKTVPFETGKFRHDVAAQTRRSCPDEEQIHRQTDCICIEAGRPDCRVRLCDPTRPFGVAATPSALTSEAALQAPYSDSGSSTCTICVSLPARIPSRRATAQIAQRIRAPLSDGRRATPRGRRRHSLAPHSDWLSIHELPDACFCRFLTKAPNFSDHQILITKGSFWSNLRFCMRGKDRPLCGVHG